MLESTVILGVFCIVYKRHPPLFQHASKTLRVERAHQQFFDQVKLAVSSPDKGNRTPHSSRVAESGWFVGPVLSYFTHSWGMMVSGHESTTNRVLGETAWHGTITLTGPLFFNKQPWVPTLKRPSRMKFKFVFKKLYEEKKCG